MQSCIFTCLYLDLFSMSKFELLFKSHLDISTVEGDFKSISACGMIGKKWLCIPTIHPVGI